MEDFTYFQVEKDEIQGEEEFSPLPIACSRAMWDAQRLAEELNLQYAREHDRGYPEKLSDLVYKVCIHSTRFEREESAS